MRNLLNICIIAFTCCLITGLAFREVQAQETGSAELTIQSISVEELPEVTVLVQGTNLSGNLSTLPLSIREDGSVREIISQNIIERGQRVAIVLDPALDLTTVGITGDVIQFEVASGASSLIQSGILSVRTDWLSAFAISSETKQFMQLTDWMRDHQAVVNTLYQYQPVEVAVQPSLETVLNDVMDTMVESANSDEVQQTILLFSDGSSLIDNSEINQTILKAQEQNIAVQVILLGDGNVVTRRNLMSIATATDAKFATYDGPASLNEIWKTLNESKRFDELTYRLGKANPSQIAVELQSNDAESVVATEDFPQIELLPANIRLVSPQRGDIIERSSENPDAGIAQLEPKSFNTEIEFSWPDNIQRNIESVEYTFNGSTNSPPSEPFEFHELSIVALDSGSYLLDIKVTDEYGIVSEIEPISIEIDANLSLAENAVNSDSSVDATTSSDDSSTNIASESITKDIVQTDASNQGMNILGLQLPETIDIFGVTFLVNGITLLIALFPIIFLLALFLYWLTQRNEQQAEPDYGYYEYDNNGYFYRFEPSTDDMQLTQPQVSVIEPEEDLTMPVKLPSFYTTAAAYLVYVSGGEHLPQKIALETNEPVRIGRKKSFCDQILDDQRVSRLHSVITFDGGDFYIKDEGSSGGTFVNRRKLGPTDNQILKHNDIVNFNEVEYRIEVAEPDSIENSNPEVESTPLSNGTESVIS